MAYYVIWGKSPTVRGKPLSLSGPELVGKAELGCVVWVRSWKLDGQEGEWKVCKWRELAAGGKSDQGRNRIYLKSVGNDIYSSKLYKT